MKTDSGLNFPAQNYSRSNDQLLKQETMTHIQLDFYFLECQVESSEKN